MAQSQTQANLALFIGETYCEIEARPLSTSNKQDDSHSSFFSKLIFLPQTSLKSALMSASLEIAKLNYKIENIYIVCRYLERLKTFRLGGSVIQVTHKGLENNYTLENTMRFSLAASSLIIAFEDKVSVSDLPALLNTEFERTRKVNPEANKVVINLDPRIFSDEKINIIKNFFKEKSFKIFSNSEPQNLNAIRRVLLNAGTEGTKEELVKEVHDAFPEAQLYFWNKNAFKTEIENYELYFSADDFLGKNYFSDNVEKIIYLDIENWMVLKKTMEPVWDSPWGKVDRPHFENTKLSLHPLTEILIDENAFLQFSKHPAASEPGPMTAGRGVKSLILDIFYTDLKEKSKMQILFPALKNANTANKIQSQFKVLEHGQKTESKTLKENDIKDFIYELIQFDISRNGCSPQNSICLGNMAFLNRQIGTQPEQANEHKEIFQWTHEIFNQVGKI